MEYIPSYTDSLYLEHHGIKGQHWGVRRFQNEDGSRTAAGKKHERDLYGTAIGSGLEIKRLSNVAKKEAKKTYKDQNKKLRDDFDSGKKSIKQLDYASKQNKAKLQRSLHKAEGDLHANRARAFENRYKKSEEDHNNSRLRAGVNDSRRGKAIRERAKADVEYAKAEGNRDNIKKAKKALRKANMNAYLWGDRAVGSTQRYMENGASRAKAIMKTAFGGSNFKHSAF